MGFSSFFFNGLSENKNKYKKEIFFKNENWKKKRCGGTRVLHKVSALEQRILYCQSNAKIWHLTRI